MLKKEYLLRLTNVGYFYNNSFSTTEDSSQYKEWKDSDLQVSSRKLHCVLFFLNLL
jgi:hypothetical protein